MHAVEKEACSFWGELKAQKGLGDGRVLALEYLYSEDMRRSHERTSSPKLKRLLVSGPVTAMVKKLQPRSCA